MVRIERLAKESAPYSRNSPGAGTTSDDHRYRRQGWRSAMNKTNDDVPDYHHRLHIVANARTCVVADGVLFLLLMTGFSRWAQKHRHARAPAVHPG
jgi:hypothetical protein